MCLQTLTTRKRGEGGRRKEGAKMIQFGFEHTHNGLFQELTRCCLKSAHRRKTKPPQFLTLPLLLTNTHIHRTREFPLSGWHPLSSTVYILLPKVSQRKLNTNLMSTFRQQDILRRKKKTTITEIRMSVDKIETDTTPTHASKSEWFQS